jgi:hypothetical protein
MIRIDAGERFGTNHQENQRADHQYHKEPFVLMIKSPIRRHNVDAPSSRRVNGSKALCLLAEVLFLVNEFFTYAGAARSAS